MLFNLTTQFQASILALSTKRGYFMTTITFDRLNLVEKLKEAKNEIKADMAVRFERIDGELKLNRWMLGVILAGVLSIVLETFF